MKSFVTMTYYHFMHATALALTFDEKPNLYFAVNYLEVSDDIIQRIRNTGIFNEVVSLDYEVFLQDISTELTNTKNMSVSEIHILADSIFERYLEPYFSEKMHSADFNDEIFVYNDLQFYYYYIAKHFKHIVGVEDGYRALEQQLRVHHFKGVYVRLIPFVEAGYYPRPLWKQPNVDYLISSCAFEGIDSYYSEKIQVRDFYDLIEENRTQFVRALKYIFNLDFDTNNHGLSILIGQPLDRCQYCSAMEYYLFNRKIIENNAGTLVIKPHPAEKLDFSLFNDRDTMTLNKAFPIELLNYCDATFKKGISFDSTSLNTLRCIEKHERILNIERPSIDEIKKSVQQYIADQALTVCVVVKARKENLEDYINARSFFTRDNRVKYRILLAIEPTMPATAEDFFDGANWEQYLKEYLTKTKKQGGAWHIGLDNLLKQRKYHLENTEIHIVRVAFDDDVLLRMAWEYAPGADYYLCIDSSNLGIRVAHSLEEYFRKNMSHIVGFPCALTFKDGSYSNASHVVEHMACPTSNTLLHRSVLYEALKCGSPSVSLTQAMLNHIDNISSKTELHLSSLVAIPQKEAGNNAVFDKRADAAVRFAQTIDDPVKREQYLVRMYASIMYDYISWGNVPTNKEDRDDLPRCIEQMQANPSMYTSVALAISQASSTFARIESTRFVYKEATELTYYQKTISWLMRKNIINRLEEVRRLRNRIQGRYRALKGRIHD